MVMMPARGEVWWAEAEDKRRPVLVVTRSEAVEVLTSIVVAPISRTMRGIPSELALGAAEGLHVDCAASFDNLRTVSWRGLLTSRLGSLGANRQQEFCDAFRASADC
jgi:mRNA interferase MazF